PVAADATLTVQDVTGKVVLVRSIEANAGFNKTVLLRREVGAAAGVLTYTLTAGEFTATRKMIVQ
ncbi:MAG: T9SS type A sorting domain-containing protein, partial [Saprospiraceae bacterium]